MTQVPCPWEQQWLQGFQERERKKTAPEQCTHPKRTEAQTCNRRLKWPKTLFSVSVAVEQNTTKYLRYLFQQNTWRTDPYWSLNWEGHASPSRIPITRAKASAFLLTFCQLVRSTTENTALVPTLTKHYGLTLPVQLQQAEQIRFCAPPSFCPRKAASLPCEY